MGFNSGFKWLIHRMFLERRWSGKAGYYPKPQLLWPRLWRNYKVNVCFFVSYSHIQGTEVGTVCCFLNFWILSQLYAEIHAVKLPHSLYSNVALRVKRSKPTFSFLGLHNPCSANTSLANAKQGPRVEKCSSPYCHMLLWIMGNDGKCYTYQPEL